MNDNNGKLVMCGDKVQVVMDVFHPWNKKKVNEYFIKLLDPTSGTDSWVCSDKIEWCFDENTPNFSKNGEWKNEDKLLWKALYDATEFAIGEKVENVRDMGDLYSLNVLNDSGMYEEIMWSLEEQVEDIVDACECTDEVWRQRARRFLTDGDIINKMIYSFRVSTRGNVTWDKWFYVQ